MKIISVQVIRVTKTSNLDQNMKTVIATENQVLNNKDVSLI